MFKTLFEGGHVPVGVEWLSITNAYEGGEDCTGHDILVRICRPIASGRICAEEYFNR